MSNYKLCYVEGDWAWFTTARLEQQWGDDWNDAPYEHNAGIPYEWAEHREMPRYSLKRLAFYGDLQAPCDLAPGGNSNYSVEMINAGLSPWLQTDSYHDGDHVSINAGCSINDFKIAVLAAGGEVYELCEEFEQEEELSAYLAGPMEYAEDYGMGWRVRIREALNPIGIRCILPNEEEAKFVGSQAELNEIKKNDPQRYKNIMRQFIKQDLEFVESVSMIITKWEGERMAGTIGEAQHAYLSNQVAYLITSKKFEEIPGWFAACYDKIFESEEEFISFMEEKYGSRRL